MSSKKLDPDDPSKEYTGVWIPKDVMECKELCATDKMTYAEIASFTECYASNEWLAERIGRSVSTASKSVNRLIELGFVEPCGFNGRLEGQNQHTLEAHLFCQFIGCEGFAEAHFGIPQKLGNARRNFGFC